MFSFFSTLKVKRFLFAGLVLVLLTGFLIGCKTEVEDEKLTEGTWPGNLVGKFASSINPQWGGDYFNITKSGETVTIKYGSLSTTGAETESWAGTVVFVSNFDSNAGAIIVQYTSGAPETNKPFHVIYYVELTSTTVSLNNTWQDNGGGNYNADTVSLDEARTKFIQDNMGNYMDFDYKTTYTKQ